MRELGQSNSEVHSHHWLFGSTAFQPEEIFSKSAKLNDEDNWKVKGTIGSHKVASINQTEQLRFKTIRNKESLYTHTHILMTVIFPCNGSKQLKPKRNLVGDTF